MDEDLWEELVFPIANLQMFLSDVAQEYIQPLQEIEDMCKIRGEVAGSLDTFPKETFLILIFRSLCFLSYTKDFKYNTNLIVTVCCGSCNCLSFCDPLISAFGIVSYVPNAYQQVIWYMMGDIPITGINNPNGKIFVMQ